MNDNPYHAVQHGEPGMVGWKILYYPELDSTQNLAARLAREGEPGGTVIVAETQSAGRGRLGHSWFSPPQTNLYLTIVLRPLLAIDRAPALSLAAGLAAARTLERFAPGMPRLKWPNDVWLNGRKLGGIIAEATYDASQGLCILLGIGLNLNLSAAQMPPALQPIATSLLIETGQPCDRATILATLLARLEALIVVLETEGFAPLMRAWENYSVLTGRRVWVSGRSEVSGIVLGIDDQGALLLETLGGLARVVAGEVTVDKIEG